MYIWFIKRLFLFFCLISPLLVLEAQTDTFAVDSIRTDLDEDLDRPLGDTTSVRYYYQTDPIVRFIDTTLNGFESPSIPWKKPVGFFSDLGHLGTPIYPLLWSSEAKAGFRSGLDMFTYLRLKPEDIPFYEIGGKKPFTDLYYSQINMQHVMLRANFAHQFNKSLYYSIHYGLINYNGFFRGQRSRHQDVALNFRYRKKNYLAYLSFINNSNNQSENGGVVTESTGLVDQLFLTNQPVQLLVRNDGSPKHENSHQTLSFRQYFNNAKESPTSAFGHHLLLQNNRYKFFDKGPAADSAFYGNFQTNNRGIRHYMKHFLIENEINWQKAFGGTLDKTSLHLKVFVSHSLNRVNQEPERFWVNNFAAGIMLSDRMNGPFNYSADAKFVNSRLGLDFWLRGKAAYRLNNLLSIGSSALFQRYEPEQTARIFFISGTEIWNNRGLLKQTQEFTLQGFLAWPRFWGKFEIQNQTISQAVYYDTEAIVRQMSGAANILQMILRQDFHVWKFHLENEIVWQRVLAGNAIFRLPEWLFRNKLYFESKVFKTMRLRSGVALRYTSAYFANAYFPVLGSFYLQDSQLMNYYPQADIFVSVKIWQLRFFVNAENLTYYINGMQNQYTAPYYPNPNWFIRIGASWQLFD